MSTIYNMNKTPHHPAQAVEAWKLGIRLLLGSLGIFFVSGILGYVVIQYQHIHLRYDQPFSIPVSLCISTICLFGSSFTIEGALSAVRRERNAAASRQMKLCCGFAALFTVFQIIGMIQVLQTHTGLFNTTNPNNIGMNGIAFTLMFTHGLHVVAGLIWLGIITHRVIRKKYDHEYYLGLTLCSYYWHFLDFIWVAMFMVFALTYMGTIWV